MTETPTDREAVERLAKNHEQYALKVLGVCSNLTSDTLRALIARAETAEADLNECQRANRETASAMRHQLSRAEAAESQLAAYAEIISDIGTADDYADEWLEKNIPTDSQPARLAETHDKITQGELQAVFGARIPERFVWIMAEKTLTNCTLDVRRAVNRALDEEDKR